MTKLLKDFQPNEQLDIPVLIKSADIRDAKDGSKYIALVFTDTSGEITAKLWHAGERALQDFTTGTVVQLSGKREVYQDRPQIRINHMRVLPESEQKPADYTPKAPESIADLQAFVKQTISEIQQPVWRGIVQYIFGAHWHDFFTFPAAKTNHHAYEGGLAFHTVSMVRLAQRIAPLYEAVNEDLLLSGTLLHDMGKTRELTGPVATQYRPEGNLIGHVVMIDEEIVQACDQLKLDSHSEAVTLLRHMVLSHHGELEYGAPVRPQIIEAELLHQIDQMDASLTMITMALADTRPGEYSERVFGLDNRRFYHHKPIA
ncbi:3'-5' exoribonuclease YhaM family protein [Schleiferilactobacillus shenzhenensis]|uniref:YhaM n=1 Tax=Schleiferilactobacillus shenzhenensis LY-73 TaxID=1231336 RepID=U4TSE8_9LACO|nr:HD domain-containing protein [Schleiferilactobacillus shenzhenensis]ERL66345.1 YhaM [Schleiferilactobacillus shenzhenensis LY-73]